LEVVAFKTPAILGEGGIRNFPAHHLTTNKPWRVAHLLGTLRLIFFLLKMAVPATTDAFDHDVAASK
jgi:hypothetical protein